MSKLSDIPILVGTLVSHHDIKTSPHTHTDTHTDQEHINVHHSRRVQTHHIHKHVPRVESKHNSYKLSTDKTTNRWNAGQLKSPGDAWAVLQRDHLWNICQSTYHKSCHKCFGCPKQLLIGWFDVRENNHFSFPFSRDLERDLLSFKTSDV